MIEPSMENSIDFSSSYYNGPSNVHEAALSFLEGKDDILYFEIICSEEEQP